jgi:hypothetical protein
MTQLEKQLMTALGKVLSLVNPKDLPPEEELVYFNAVEVLTDAVSKCDDCVDY